MKKRVLMIASGLAVALSIAAAPVLASSCGGCAKKPAAKAKIAKPAGKEQTLCPIMGGKIDKKFFADHDGKRVYFCCTGCIAKFKKDAAKYIKQMEDKGIKLAGAQKSE